MSLLFCMWADQEEAKEEVNDSKQDSSNEETNDAKVESGKEIESHSGEKSEDTTKVATNFPEEHTEQSKDITESDDSPPKENDLEEGPSEKKESEEPPLKKNKPEEPPRKKFVGPRSVMLKRMEKKAAAARNGTATYS